MQASNVKKSIDLIWLSEARDTPSWNLGRVLSVEPSVRKVAEAVRKYLEQVNDNLLLFWDSRLPVPNENVLANIQKCRGDLWHAGLRLGLSGHPRLGASVDSTWLLNADPDPLIESTSWRLSLRAALIPARIFHHFEFIRPEFEGIDAAGLELGHRLITNGVLIRHMPQLLPDKFKAFDPEISFQDEIRFISACFGPNWLKWTLMRAVLNKRMKLFSVPKELKVALATSKKPAPYHQKINGAQQAVDPTITILIPTLDRYEYLRKLLNQLRRQTIKPLEIIIIDQMVKEHRDTALAEDFKDLPLKIIYRDQAGQCSSRNAGLQTALGEYILFLDDDSEVPDDLIEKHLNSLNFFKADASSGVAEEIGAGPVPEGFRLIRISDVFPTNNTLIHRSVLNRSGLFDLAYERGQRADGDLGMRVYLSGAFMVLNPDIRILHYHAPRGGLRAHKARVITYASSRNNIFHRHLPSTTEIYLAQRYFSDEILRESLWLRVAGTFSIRGSMIRKVAKILISGLLLPHSLITIRRRIKEAERMAQHFPQIPFPTGQTSGNQ